MKNNILLLTFFLAEIVSLVSCTDETPKVTINKDLASNELKSLSSADYILSIDNADKAFEKFQWTAPDYGFATSVTYTIQLDTAGNNFANAIELISTTGNKLSDSILIGDLNKKLLSFGLPSGQKSHVEIRVKSVINANVETVYSNVLSFTITPYAVVFPPIYIIGDVQSWTLGNAVALTSTSPGVYETIVNFQNGKKFRFFATADWGAQQWGFSFFGAASPNLGDGADADSNFLFTGATGTYHIVVSTQSKTITIKSAQAPTLYLIGQDQGWTLGNAVTLVWQGGDTFVGTATFTNQSTFRFFTAPDWAKGTVNTASFEGGMIDTNLASKNDSDKNFVFVGTTGSYKITVSTDTKVIKMESTSPPPPTTLYIIGDDQSWTLGNAVALTSLGNGKFQGTTIFTNSKIFRFFVVADWGAKQYGYNAFAGGTIDAKLTDGGGSDSNFQFVGTTGSHTITVDLVALTVAMN